MTNSVDVLIVGAGLSGIGFAYHLSKNSPDKSFAIIESREALGGTWDLFRYPGVRSDSDMYTLGYVFKPWAGEKSLADGPSILKYITEVAQENGFTSKIQYNRRVSKIEWCSVNKKWTATIKVANSDVLETIQCNFVSLCAGLYNCEEGYLPNFPKVEAYQGQLVHPQKWPENLDYKNKKVVVIGSGATAVTLVPSMATETAHITMLQRSPTYVASLPSVDRKVILLRKIFSEEMVYKIIRKYNVLFQQIIYKVCRKYPNFMKKVILTLTRMQVGRDFDMKHLTPSYNLWDQRLCAVPDGDLFKAIREKRASIVTDTIKEFVPEGILLNSGQVLDADIVVTATGLNIQMFGAVEVVVDGVVKPLHKCFTYKSCMLSGIPNLGYMYGYSNASWTLRSDITSNYLCRLINLMDSKGYKQAVPVPDDDGMGEVPFINLTSGFIMRSENQYPKQGDREPWLAYQNYAADKKMLQKGQIEDGMMQFS